MTAVDRLAEIEQRYGDVSIADASRYTLIGRDVPDMLAALRAVLDLHKPVARFLVDGFEEVSYSSRERAIEETEGDPRAVTEWMLCEECARVEDGADGEGPAEVGYANADYPCPTVRAVEAVIGEVAS